jgi:hypothetical protein
MATTTTTRTKPACIADWLPDVGIYVACLASYNGGILQGAWVDLEQCQDEEDIQAGIDWERAWRELTYTDGYREEPCSSGGVHIFRSC